MKWIFLWRPGVAARIEAFGPRARDLIATRLASVRSVTLHVTERDTPRISLVPFAHRALAMITVRGSVDAMETTREGLRGLEGSLAGYRVDETVPRRDARRVGVGERVPGCCMLTLFRRNPRLDRPAFFREWYGRHTPLALAIHPTVGYARNAIEEPVLPGSPHLDGIVTEDFATDADALRPTRLFGGPILAVPNMIRVGLHASWFLDLRTLENHLVAQYVLSA